uniref:Uncharacterized protein n=1 Tax=Ananas comosus var. bracteatus TaxID=296719 RepID=A0A6V7Q547_ANACO|nr:unnamed protein product [Ananas comosus var. bracteatus]
MATNLVNRFCYPNWQSKHQAKIRGDAREYRVKEYQPASRESSPPSEALSRKAIKDHGPVGWVKKRLNPSNPKRSETPHLEKVHQEGPVDVVEGPLEVDLQESCASLKGVDVVDEDMGAFSGAQENTALLTSVAVKGFEMEESGIGVTNFEQVDSGSLLPLYLFLHSSSYQALSLGLKLRSRYVKILPSSALSSQSIHSRQWLACSRNVEERPELQFIQNHMNSNNINQLNHEISKLLITKVNRAGTKPTSRVGSSSDHYKRVSRLVSTLTACDT